MFMNKSINLFDKMLL